MTSKILVLVLIVGDNRTNGVNDDDGANVLERSNVIDMIQKYVEFFLDSANLGLQSPTIH